VYAETLKPAEILIVEIYREVERQTCQLGIHARTAKVELGIDANTFETEQLCRSSSKPKLLLSAHLDT